MSKLLSFAALLLTVTATTAVSAAEKITLIHSVPQLTSLFAFGSSIPLEMGFWKEEGLEVEALPAPGGAAAAVQLVIGGRATAAIANPSSEMIAVQRGARSNSITGLNEATSLALDCRKAVDFAPSRI
jgi:NitT/TauT family transport system substrate-binding protein